MSDLLQYKYLEMCDDEEVSALDIVNLIFNECRVSIKVSDDSLELVEVITAKRYGKARREAIYYVDKAQTSCVTRASSMDATRHLKKRLEK